MEVQSWWQVQDFVGLGVQISWQAQDFLWTLKCRFRGSVVLCGPWSADFVVGAGAGLCGPWSADFMAGAGLFVDLEVQISWQV